MNALTDISLSFFSYTASIKKRDFKEFPHWLHVSDLETTYVHIFTVYSLVFRVFSVRSSAKHNLRVIINTLVAVNSEGSCVFIIISSKPPQVKFKVNTNEPPDRTAKVTCQLSYLNWSLET